MMSPRPMRGAPFQQGVAQSPGTPQRLPSLSSGVVNGAMSAQRQGRSMSPLGNDQPQGYVFQGAEQNPNQFAPSSPQGVQGVQARRGLPRTSGNPYSVGMQNYDPRTPVKTTFVRQELPVMQLAPFMPQGQQPAAQQGSQQEQDPYAGMGMLDIINQVAEDARRPKTATSSSGLTANPNPPGQVDPNQTAQPASNAPPVQTSNRINSNAGEAPDPLEGLAPHEREALLKGAADNQITVERARALWDQGYRPESYWGGGGSYNSSWYKESDETDFILDQDGKRWSIGKKGDELGMDADEGGRAMADNLLAEREASRERQAEADAQAEFDSLIERILGMEGPDITQALEASRMARENALNRGNRALYSSSMDPRAMQAAGADFNENLATQGALQDANLALQKEMIRYANQIDALKMAASLAGNVAQARKLNDVTIDLQNKLAVLAQQNALFERNLMTPSAGEMAAAFGMQVGGGLLTLGAKKAIGL